MVNCKVLCIIACIAIFGVAFAPQQVAGAGRKRLLIAYLVAKSLKPRIVPIPLPLPLPIKFKKESHASYPVHHHSHSAHAEYAGGHGMMGGGY